MKEMVLTGGDWPVFYSSFIHQLSWIPEVWSTTNGNGFGQNVAFVLGYKTFFTILVKLFQEVFGFSWHTTEMLIFFIPFWIFSFYFSYILSRYFLKNEIYNILTSIIFSTNTYSLMLVGGGQMGVAIAYAISPFVFLLFLKLVDGQSLRSAGIAGLALGILLMVDPRIAGAVLLLAVLFLLFSFSIKKSVYFFITIFLGVLLNSFWVLPFLFSGTTGLTEAYTGTDILYFLSFAKLENSFGLLHPNWPENFFGKVGFMRSEFLILPIIAFSVFLFKTDKKVKILGLCTILGIFLSKGVNEPFGFLYYFLSDYIPAFTMFRDSTKWYLLVTISYSILIPIALYKITKLVDKTKKISILNFQFQNKFRELKFYRLMIVVIFLLFWAITIRQLLLGSLTGTFQAKEIPSEYVKLEKLLVSDTEFSRVLWVPQQSRFGYYSNVHPPVAAYDLITSHDVKPITSYLKKRKTENFIKKGAIKYVIVPYDPLGEIYLTNRKYDEKVNKDFLTQIKNIPYLTQDLSFKEIGVFRVKNNLSHAYFDNGKAVILEQISSTKYKGVLDAQKKLSKIIFSETYDSSWRLKAPDQDVQSQKYLDKFNSFVLLPGTRSFEIIYETQALVSVGVPLSCFAFGVLFLLILFAKR